MKKLLKKEFQHLEWDWEYISDNKYICNELSRYYNNIIYYVNTPKSLLIHLLPIVLKFLHATISKWMIG